MSSHPTQAIGLLDDLDKELNTYAMRVREWYGWHFPEMTKIVSDNIAYAKTGGWNGRLGGWVGGRVGAWHGGKLSGSISGRARSGWHTRQHRRRRHLPGS